MFSAALPAFSPLLPELPHPPGPAWSIISRRLTSPFYPTHRIPLHALHAWLSGLWQYLRRYHGLSAPALLAAAFYIDYELRQPGAAAPSHETLRSRDFGLAVSGARQFYRQLPAGLRREQQSALLSGGLQATRRVYCRGGRGECLVGTIAAAGAFGRGFASRCRAAAAACA